MMTEKVKIVEHRIAELSKTLTVDEIRLLMRDESFTDKWLSEHFELEFSRTDIDQIRTIIVDNKI